MYNYHRQDIPTTYALHPHLAPHKVHSTLPPLPLRLSNSSFNSCVPDLNLNRILLPASLIPCLNPMLNFTPQSFSIQLTFPLTNTFLYTSHNAELYPSSTSCTHSALSIHNAAHPPLYPKFSSVYLYEALYSTPDYKVVWGIYPQA